jgi:hypothetical protein
MPGTEYQDDKDSGIRMAHVGADHYRVSYGDSDDGSQHLNSEGASHMKPTMVERTPVRAPVVDLAVHPGQGTLDLGQLKHAPGDLARAGHHLGILQDRPDPRRQALQASRWTSPMEGQGVIPMHHIESPDGTPYTSEIDAHGNNRDIVTHPGFKLGPQMSHGNAYLWKRYGTDKNMDATTPVTTTQSPDNTGDTSYIKGELRGTAMRVGLVKGEAHAFDGHHRTQQLRGRGEATIPIRHLDMDALTKKHGSWQGALVAHGFSYDGQTATRTPGLEHELTSEQVNSPAPRGTYAAMPGGEEPVRQGKPRILAGAQFGAAQPAFRRS